MDVHQRHLDAGLLIAIEGNRLLGEQLRRLVPTGAASFDAAFVEDGWPPHAGRQPFALSIRPIIATSVACDLARLLMFLDQGGAILTSDLLCRYVLEATATGTWILRPGMTYLDEPWPDDRERFMDETRRRRIERALAAKFAPGTPLAAWLLGTLPYAIAEGNTWGDRFWGQVREDGAWVGENWLGVLLMARRAELVALDAMPSVRVGGHRFDDLMVLAEALGVAERPPLMPGCLEVDPPVEIEDEGPAPCTNALCSWPSSRCRIDEEFAGVVDAEGFYDPGDTDTCASMLAEQADG